MKQPVICRNWLGDEVPEAYFLDRYNVAIRDKQPGPGWYAASLTQRFGVAAQTVDFDGPGSASLPVTWIRPGEVKIIPAEASGIVNIPMRNVQPGSSSYQPLKGDRGPHGFSGPGNSAYVDGLGIAFGLGVVQDPYFPIPDGTSQANNDETVVVGFLWDDGMTGGGEPPVFGGQPVDLESIYQYTKRRHIEDLTAAG